MGDVVATDMASKFGTKSVKCDIRASIICVGTMLCMVGGFGAELARADPAVQEHEPSTYVGNDKKDVMEILEEQDLALRQERRRPNPYLTKGREELRRLQIGFQDAAPPWYAAVMEETGHGGKHRKSRHSQDKEDERSLLQQVWEQVEVLMSWILVLGVFAVLVMVAFVPTMN